jgi:hypothetical protein
MLMRKYGNNEIMQRLQSARFFGPWNISQGAEEGIARRANAVAKLQG